MDPALAGLRLRRLLSRARAAAGITQGQAAAAAGMSHSKLIRMEGGQTPAAIPEVRMLLELYGALDQLPEAETLARAAKHRHWTSAYARDVLTNLEASYIRLEPVASAVHYVGRYVLPALLRSEEYARRLARRRLPAADPQRVERLVAVCLRRQQLLADDPPQLRFFLDQAALLRGPDVPVAREQLHHLVEVAGRPQLDIRVVPFAAGFMPTDHSFALLELDDPPATMLYLEDPHGGLVRNERANQVADHWEALAWCDKHAMPVEQAVDAANRTI